jgi:hypothetical protein
MLSRLPREREKRAGRVPVRLEEQRALNGLLDGRSIYRLIVPRVCPYAVVKQDQPSRRAEQTADDQVFAEGER